MSQSRGPGARCRSYGAPPGEGRNSAGPCPENLLARQPLFNQMIANWYAPSEGIRAHVDLLRFEDGIAIISLLSPASCPSPEPLPLNPVSTPVAPQLARRSSPPRTQHFGALRRILHSSVLRRMPQRKVLRCISRSSSPESRRQSRTQLKSQQRPGCHLNARGVETLRGRPCYDQVTCSSCGGGALSLVRCTRPGCAAPALGWGALSAKSASPSLFASWLQRGTEGYRPLGEDGGAQATAAAQSAKVRCTYYYAKFCIININAIKYL